MVKAITLSMDEVAVQKGYKYETVLYDENLGAIMRIQKKIVISTQRWNFYP